jgi:hypothetical protein
MGIRKSVRVVTQNVTGDVPSVKVDGQSVSGDVHTVKVDVQSYRIVTKSDDLIG